jgi:hypothetical protein
MIPPWAWDYEMNSTSHFAPGSDGVSLYDAATKRFTVKDGSYQDDCIQVQPPSPASVGNGGFLLAMRDAMDQPEGTASVPLKPAPVSFQEQEEERRKLRRLQIMMSMVMSVISQDTDLSVEEASELAANAKRAALAMFPDKEFAYDILYKPRLQRLMAERFRLQ